MKILKLLALLSFVALVAGGGSSQCGSLQADIAPIVLALEEALTRLIATISDIIHTYPALTNSFLSYFECYSKASYNILANATSQLTGVDIDYIRGILNATITPPFIAPLDCLESDLLAFNAYVNNITQNTVPALQALKEASPITASTPCLNVTQISNFYYQALLLFSNKQVNDTIENGATFTSIGKLDLFLAEMGNIYDCGRLIVINGMSEVLNIDPAITASFLQDNSVVVGPPLNCVESIVVGIDNTVKTALDSANSSVSTVAAPNCDPPFSQFRALKNVWYTYINQLQVFASNSANNNTFLAPFYVTDFNCQLDIMIIFIANATNILTGVDSEIVYQILTTNVSEPFVSPLDCISVDLLFMRELISTYKNIVIPGIMAFATVATPNLATCQTTYAALSSTVPLLVQFFYEKEPFVTQASASFQNLGYLDLYLDSFGAVASCTPASLGAFVGAVLNTNGAPVASFLSGGSMTVPYPFSCVRTIINIMNNAYSTALIDFVVGDPLTLTVTVPPYRG